MYLALYRKYRPVSFEDVISQEHITTTLKNQLISGKTAHAYLFTGPRGTGKTTCSKILAMAVNCENLHDGNPCMECESCKSIAEGRTMDVVEIDGASNNRVDDIRDLREEAVYSPASCKYRVYIIDEVHMLSSGAFNALLKIMEEPPAHVKFIMATTEAHKVPATILSRCQQFDFRRVRTEDIAKRLLDISQKEDFTLTDEAAEVIARLADGGMRDALSLLDQAAAYSTDITADTVADAAGISGREPLFSLIECIASADASGAIEIIADLYGKSKDLQRLLGELVHQLRNIMLIQTLKNPENMLDVLPDETEKLKEYARALPPIQVLNIISDMQECMDSMARSIDRRTSLELCFIKLCTPSMNTSNADVAARLERLEAIMKNSNGAISAPLPNEEKKVEKKPQKSAIAKNEAKEAENTEQVATEQILQSDEEISPLAEKEAPTKRQAKAKEESKSEAPPADNKAESEQTPHPLECLTEVMDELQRTTPSLYAALQKTQILALGNALYITPSNSMFTSILKKDDMAARLVAVIEQKCGIKYKLLIKTQKPSEKPKAEEKITDLLNKARESGVEVKEK